jgi:hypothetical protein
MKVSSTNSAARIVRSFVITEGNPVVHMAYSSPVKEVVVDRGTIEYTFENGRWIVKNHWAVEVVGDVLKKDRTRSKNAHKRTAADAPNTWSSPELVVHETWAWLQPIIDLLRPNGDLSMMVLTEAEVRA